MSYYAVLELKSGASQNEIKSAYKKLALKYHPDKNPNVDATIFHQISTAYTILSNEETKEIYDQNLNTDNQFSEFLNTLGSFNITLVNICLNIMSDYFKTKTSSDSIDYSGSDFNIPDPYMFLFKNISDNFDNICTNYDIDHRTLADTVNSLYQYYINQSKIEGKNIEIQLNVNIEEMYSQNIKKYNVKRYRICSMCSGNGNILLCNSCGSNVYHNLICINCFGSELTEYVCSQCEKTKCSKIGHYISNKIYMVPLINNTMIFNSEADECFEYNSVGNVIFHINIKPHPIFRIYKNHLVMKKKISLYEYLFGFDFKIKHPSGKVLRITYEGHLNMPIYRVEGMGMPTNQDNEYGDLFIHLLLDKDSLDKKILQKQYPPIQTSGGEQIENEIVIAKNAVMDNEDSMIEYISANQDNANTVNSIDIIS